MFFYYPPSAMSTPRQIVSPLCLFTRRALPLDSAHSALDVRDALGNGCFPLPPPPKISPPREKPSASCPLVCFHKGLHQDEYPAGQREQARRPCVHLKSAPKKKKSVELT